MASRGGGGGDKTNKGPIRRGSARKGIFFRLQVNEREGISLVEVYKMVGKTVIFVKNGI